MCPKHGIKLSREYTIYKGMVHFINILNILLSQFFAAEDLLKKKKQVKSFLV